MNDKTNVLSTVDKNIDNKTSSISLKNNIC